jgi:hypothetical protein
MYWSSNNLHQRDLAIVNELKWRILLFKNLKYILETLPNA